MLDRAPADARIPTRNDSVFNIKADHAQELYK